MTEPNPTKGKQRRAGILNVLKQNGRISVQEIVARFQCSEATARRDLDLLEQTEPIVRTIGGALFDGYSSARETSFSERKNVSWIEKEAIAAKAASLITEGDIIGLSGGTTTYLIAKQLKARRGITVVTNAVNIAMELADNDDIQVLVTGGMMRNKSFELCGPLAERMVEHLNIGKMFIGIDGITASLGLSTFSESEAQIAKVLIKRSEHTYAVFDHSKLGKGSLFSIAPLSSLHACITDELTDDAIREELDRLHVQIYLTQSEEKERERS
ncbi:GntR family transcriptional regulator [Paenibacillus sp. J31TS4]|uniref:DeoR/GlpR family DNA-binding transcription regulator n=1 Tax=Paenibacillus sp. J31TS4 TaxID=2807195 RepID=UPI001AFE9EF1|nr:DeoR/GlpR family DNA-binding transcription regulator [Paenibacillus sp. J31TS4]GIP37265.1 GntR family transcriptional regulator [Paenibacillus sp. J31TS4]